MGRNGDKVTVGLTPQGEKHLEEVMESRFVDEELTAYRVAIAVALASGVSTSTEEMKNVTTKFNVGSLEQDGKLREMIEVLKPDASEGKVFSYAECLADAGMAELADVVSSGSPLRKTLLRGLSSE